jgi:urease alpha subunit
MSLIDRRAYGEIYGPTKGDRGRLGDTELVIEVAHDRTTYGEEVNVWGRQGHSRRDGSKPADFRRNVCTSQQISDISLQRLLGSEVIRAVQGGGGLKWWCGMRAPLVRRTTVIC